MVAFCNGRKSVLEQETFAFNFPLSVEFTKYNVNLKIARFAGGKASCLQRRNYINQIIQQHSFSGNYSWISNQFLLYFTVWTMIYVIAGTQILFFNPLKTRCRFKCKSLNNVFVLSIVSFYQVPSRGKSRAIQILQWKNKYILFLSCRHICINCIWVLCTSSIFTKLS